VRVLQKRKKEKKKGRNDRAIKEEVCLLST